MVVFVFVVVDSVVLTWRVVEGTDVVIRGFDTIVNIAGVVVVGIVVEIIIPDVVINMERVDVNVVVVKTS